ncbi:STAS-like domain-containing protein [Candidatus Woesearchaeota archaeon]|nr:MAG: hypothetical protein QS99_C0009G0045 [archaeon GW2011_AR4]MBS3129719.1 STAS-like domain-containing protein [Candidatus Woesearchaeota archaeon]HIH37412.1 STAS-like domain-containing protein [Candidatus Woesearchaeota archaeon]HIH48290.1 STAS-like domain-containing protein [Candidatus Woesearchaeota archaeon]HIJ02899.1 STAS-like domain-containing protein [Candidatus Woesearchaeota archaeon]
MKKINLLKKVGSFAENKDKARDIRLHEIIPALEKNEEVILDFKQVESATQSFIHALISDLIRKYGIEILDMISFKNCNETIKKIITIVVDYMQETD